MNRAVMLLMSQLVVLFSCLTSVAHEVNVESGQAAPQFENPLLPLKPVREQSEAESDRVTASALYAHGRLLLRREDYANALRRFQRAWRYDPNAVPILNEIIVLTRGLRRLEEFARYEIISQEMEPNNLELINQLAEMLTANRDFERALRLYDASMELRKKEGSKDSLAVQQMNMGRLYFLTGQFEKSAESFTYVRDALADPSKFGLNRQTERTLLGEADRTYLLLAESFYQAQRFEDAEQMFRKANESKENKALLALNLARIDAENDQTDAALAYLEEFFDASGSSGGREPYLLLRELLETKLGDAKKAEEEVYRRLSKIHDEAPNAALSYYLAELARQLDKFDVAEEIYQGLLKDEPTVGVYQRLAELYRQENRLDDLLNTLGSAVDLAVEVVQTITLDTLGDEIQDLADDEELVAQLIDAATKRADKESNSLDAGVALGIALVATGAQRFDEADKFFQLAIDQPDADKSKLMFSWAFNMYLDEQYDRAVRVFQRGIDENLIPEKNLDTYYYLTGALASAGKTEEALAIARQSIQLSPNQEDLEGQIPWILFRTRLPWVYYQAKQYDRAEEAYLAFLEQYDADHSSSLIRQSARDVRLVMSNICVYQDRISEAEEWLEQVLDEFPEDIGALNDLGYLWADQSKHLNRALAMVRKAVDDEPDNIAYLDSLGWAYYQLGRYEEARVQLEKAAQGDNTDGVILDHLGDAYLKNKQTQQAIATWKRAVEAFKNSDELKLLEKTTDKIKRHSME